MKSLRGHGHDRNSVQTYLNGILFLTYLLRISFSTTLRFALNRWDKSAGSVITAMKSMYERHGILLEVIADNMPFSNKNICHFAKNWGLQVITSSLRYPQSNGMSERETQTIKKVAQEMSRTLLCKN